MTIAKLSRPLVLLLLMLGACQVNSAGLATAQGGNLPGNGGIASTGGSLASGGASPAQDASPLGGTTSLGGAPAPVAMGGHPGQGDAGDEVGPPTPVDATVYDAPYAGDPSDGGAPVGADGPPVTGKADTGGADTLPDSHAVLPDGAGTVDSREDAPPLSPEAESCIAQGGTFSGTDTGGTCRFDCSETSRCPNRIHCPMGLACVITCGAGSCQGPIDCGQANHCTLNCEGEGSCAGEVTCGGPQCDVTCSGPASCGKGINAAAGISVLTCAGEGSCAKTIQCGGDTCETRCTGPDTCERGVLTSASTNLVQCSGLNSCQTRIQCNGANCRILCQNLGTCVGGITCNASVCSYF
jgi:hypothetical protein